MKKLLVIICLLSKTVFADNISGLIIDAQSGKPVDYVSIGISGKNKGTVSDYNGKFSIHLTADFNNDTLRFSKIGYNSNWILISELKAGSVNTIKLSPKSYELKEVEVLSKFLVTKTLGVTTSSRFLSLGVEENSPLGFELGILMKNKKPGIIKQVKINIAEITYDTLFFRLNIYTKKGENYETILNRPIYFQLSRQDIKNTIVINLRSENIEVKEDFLVAVENVKSLGKGRFYFCCGLKSNTLTRNTSEDSWYSIPFGISISADVEY
jgi:hypothetical protein